MADADDLAHGTASTPGASTLPALLATLATSEGEVLRDALRALREVDVPGATYAEIARAALPFLEHADGSTRLVAASVVAERWVTWFDLEAACDVLIASSRDRPGSSCPAHDEAARALAEALAPILEARLDVRDKAVEALGWTRAHGARLLHLVRPLTDDPDPEVRRLAADALARLEGRTPPMV